MTLDHIKKRLTDMRSARAEFDLEFDLADLQFNADSYEDPVTGRFMYNDDMEQSLIEMEVGRTSWEIIFDVKPSSYDVDIQQLEASKHILRSFLEKENSNREFRTFKQDKGRYGTGIFFTGVRYDSYFMSKVEDQEVGSIVNWFYSKKFKKKIKVENWFFTPQNLPIRSVYLDDRFLWQNNPDKMEDCIIHETVTYETLEQRYKGNKSFSQKWLGTQWGTDVSPDYARQPNDSTGIHHLYHYYNRKTRMFAIMLNERYIIYEGEMQYTRNALPIRLAQHYPDSACLYGISTPKKVRSYKAVKINMMQSIIDGVRLGSGKLLATTNWSQFLDNIYVPSGGIGMAEMSDSVDNFREIDTRVDINWPISAMELVEKWIRESTGLDIWAPFETKDETLWQTEIREQNKVTRHKAMDEIYYQCVDQALTDTLENIAQFAPTLLRSTKSIKINGKNEIESIERPKIKIENVTIERNKWEIYIEEDFGSYWYLELRPQTIPWDCSVHIITPYTNNVVADQIEKEWINKLVENIVALWNVYWPEVVNEIAPLEEVRGKISRAYKYEDNKFNGVSKKEKARREVKEKLKKMNEMNQSISSLLSNQQPNEAITGQWSTGIQQVSPAQQGTPAIGW